MKNKGKILGVVKFEKNLNWQDSCAWDEENSLKDYSKHYKVIWSFPFEEQHQLPFQGQTGPIYLKPHQVQEHEKILFFYQKVFQEKKYFKNFF